MLINKFKLKTGKFKLLSAINLLLGFLLLLAILMLARTLVLTTYKKSVRPEAQTRLIPRNLTGRNLQDYEVILKNNPFGFAAGPLKSISAGTEQGSAQSEVTLIGTIAGAKQHSYAIFADRNGKQEVIRVGAKVFGLGRLLAVNKDKAVIKSDNGNLEIPLADVLKIVEVSQPQGNAAASAFAKNIGEGAYLVDQKKIQQAIENPNQLMTDARLQPNLTDGRQEGFILREVKNGGIYQSLGLQNNDVLLRINDYNISNPESGLQAFTALRGMDRIRLDIMRNGARMTLTYQIK